MLGETLVVKAGEKILVGVISLTLAGSGMGDTNSIDKMLRDGRVESGTFVKAVSLEDLKNKVKEKLGINQELIDEELQELEEDYEDFEEEYLDDWVEGLDDYDGEWTENDLNEFKDDAIENYVSRREFEKMTISNNTWGHLEKQIGQEEMKFIRMRSKSGNGISETEEIIKSYLRNKFGL